MGIHIITSSKDWTGDNSFVKSFRYMDHGDRVAPLDQREILNLIRVNRDKFNLPDEHRLRRAEPWAHLAEAGEQLFVSKASSLTVWQWQ